VIRVLVAVVLVGFAWPLTAQDLPSLAKAYVPPLDRILKENIAAFWYPRCLDRQRGGYIIDFGPKGEVRSGGNKGIVTQARMLWLFSKMVQEGYGGRDYLEAADWGYRFLKDKMWDPRYGGFYWAVDASGSQSSRPMKHLYGQSFALYAVSEYYLASHLPEVLDFAIRIFNLLEAKAHDKEYGGYVELFNPDWTTPAPGAESYMGKDRNDLKLMNTHLHLMEAITTFYRASRVPLARERLLELIIIESNSVVRKNVGACTDEYARNWTPRLESRSARASYGHDLENVWLLMDACQAVGLPNSLFMDLYRTLFDYSLRYGYDAKNGGFFSSGPLNSPADDLSKSWWVQAEVLVSALYMYRARRDEKYAQVFEQTFKFVEAHLVDWTFGEWYQTILPDGKVMADKANLWKAGYHNGRAMMECLAILKGKGCLD
jgi:mannobiose 2-epimerase